MNRNKLVQIAKENIDIIKNGKFNISGKEIFLDVGKIRQVKTYPVEYKYQNFLKNISGDYGKIIIEPVDSFEALNLCDPSEKTCVLNFASAKKSGGGFLTGAKAQEEDLCYRSTLYGSLETKDGFEMYKYNLQNYNLLYSDFMLYSPYVSIIRDKNYNLIENIINTSIITAPAVNRNLANREYTSKEIFKCMLKRAEKILCIALENQNDNIILGAWGCGVFRNSVTDIAEIFRILLIDKQYAKLFKNIIFASFNEKNNAVFSSVFEK